MGHGWDETEEKGVCVVTLEEEAKVRFVPLDGPRFYDLKVDVTSGPEAALDRILPAAECDDFFRITLTGQAEPDLEALQKKFVHLTNLFLRDETIPVQDLWEDTGSDTFRGVYFRLLHQQAQTEPLAVLAAEISKKILSGREVDFP